jgi:transcription elongation factor Elf1
MVSVTCPHCEEEFEDVIEDYHEDEQYEAECPNCEKVFGYNICISISTNSIELPCGGQDGDGPHEWKPIIGWPKEYFENKFRCVHCDLEKEMK